MLLRTEYDIIKNEMLLFFFKRPLFLVCLNLCRKDIRVYSFENVFFKEALNAKNLILSFQHTETSFRLLVSCYLQGNLKQLEWTMGRGYTQLYMSQVWFKK
jgi:hypothetical protein